MVRPRSRRWVECNPRATFFKPAGVPMTTLEIVSLNLDELEAMHLVDFEGRDQTAAAERMKVSRSTVARLLESGRRKVTEALLSGRALEIQRGDAPINFHRACGPRGRGRGRGARGRQ